MTKILSKRFIQIALLSVVLGSAFSSADSSTRLEPIGAPVPVESVAETKAQGSLEPDVHGTGQEPDSFERAISNELQSAFPERERESFSWALLIPIVAMAFVFGGPIALIIVIAVLHYRSKNRRAQIKAELTLKALETGRELPPELTKQNSSDTPEANLRKGIKNIGLGIGIVAGISFLVGFDIGALGFVLVAIGAAQLVLWKLENPKPKDAA